MAAKKYDSLEEALDAFDREKEEKQKEPEDIVAEFSVDAGVWDGEIDESVQLVQILGIPGVDAEDLGLVWEIQ